MVTVTLRTRRGELVERVQIPNFTPPPEVITWGLRTFIRQSDGDYREAMA